MIFKKGSVRRSLKYSIFDGLFTAMMMGVSETYLIPYGIALGANPSQVAFLASVPTLIGSWLQMRSAALTQSIGSRLKLINFVVFFHALAWLPMILLPYLLSSPAHAKLLPWVLMACAVAFVSFGAFGVPAWQSLMSDYIPVKKRGRYFGWRNRLQGFFMTAVSVAGGLLLQRFGSHPLVGFTILFAFAMLCRFSAWLCLLRMVEPFRKSTHDDYFSYWKFLKGIPSRNFARFTLFVSMVSFSVSISGPLLAVYLLKDLGFNYVHYMIVVTAASMSGFLFQKLWGKYADRHGNVRVIRFAVWGIAVIPLFWMISHNLAYLFFVQIFAGAVWGGFNLLTANFAMEAVSPQKRIRCLSYLNVTNSTAVFLGAALGGLLFHRLPPTLGYSFLTLFLLSCVCRLATALFGSRIVREIRRKQAVWPQPGEVGPYV